MKIGTMIAAVVALTSCTQGIQVSERPPPPDVRTIDNPRLAQQFRQLDTDNNSLLSQEEFYAQPQAARKLKMYNRFGQADFNADGEIDKAEFSAFEAPASVD